MEIETIAGRKSRRKRRRERRARRKARRARRGGFFKRLGKGIAKVAKKGWKGFKKLNPVLVFGRNAFLTLVKLNFNGLATKLDRAMKDKKANGKLRKLWGKRLAGKISVLERAIRQGRRKAIRKGINGLEYVPGPLPMGEPTLAATLAAAGPILAAIAVILKELKAKGVDLDKLPGAEKIGELADKAKQAMPDLFDLTQFEIMDEDAKSAQAWEDAIASGTDPDEASSIIENTGKNPGIGMILPVAIVAAVMIMSKK